MVGEHPTFKEDRAKTLGKCHGQLQVLFLLSQLRLSGQLRLTSSLIILSLQMQRPAFETVSGGMGGAAVGTREELRQDERDYNREACLRKTAK